MPKITDAGMNNAGVIDGLRLPQLASMFSLMSLDYAGGTPTLRPNQLLFQHFVNNSDAFDFGDGQGVQKGITMFDLDESIKRVIVGAFFPGHQMTQDLLAAPAQWPVPRYEGDLLLVRAGAAVSGTPTISAKDAVYAWSPAGVAAASGAPYADVAGGNTGAWVDATPALVAKGLIATGGGSSSSSAVISTGSTPPANPVAGQQWRTTSTTSAPYPKDCVMRWTGTAWEYVSGIALISCSSTLNIVSPSTSTLLQFPLDAPAVNTLNAAVSGGVITIPATGMYNLQLTVAPSSIVSAEASSGQDTFEYAYGFNIDGTLKAVDTNVQNKINIPQAFTAAKSVNEVRYLMAGQTVSVSALAVTCSLNLQAEVSALFIH